MKLCPGEQRILERIGPVRGARATASLLAMPRYKCGRLINKLPKPRAWTAEENEYLKQRWLIGSVQSIATQLQRHPEEIISRAEELNMRIADEAMLSYYRWEPWQDEIVRAKYQTAKVETIAAMVHRSIQAVQERAQALGVNAQPSPAWSEQEDAAIRAMWSTHSSAEMSAVIKRSADAVRARGRAIGLQKKPSGNQRRRK